jgi:hypothetical protein
MAALQDSSRLVVRVSHSAGAVLVGGAHVVVVGAETAVHCSHLVE